MRCLGGDMADVVAVQYHQVMIFCVVPEALEDELLDKLTSYYADDSGVTVIVERRKSSRRERGQTGGGKREIRDRRRARVPGELPELASD